MINAQMRSFAKKKGSKKSAASEEVTEEETVEEPEPTPEPTPEPVKAAPKEAPPASTANFSDAGKAEAQAPVDKSLFGAFSVGDVKKVQTTDDHKAPFKDDSVPGRYAEVLFTTASQ